MASEVSTSAAPAKKELTAERVRELLVYDLETGDFVRRVTQGSARAGAAAGTLDSKGYVRIRVDGRKYAAHRLAWLWMKGKWPVGQIDHRNHIRCDNRFDNLRNATHGQNKANAQGWAASGFKGVIKRGNRWVAQITHNGPTRYLGLFKTPEEAHAAYCQAAAKLFGDFACVGHQKTRATETRLTGAPKRRNGRRTIL